MITMLGSRRRLCDGMTRRETLKAGALSLLGGVFNLPSLLALEERGQVRPAKAKSVILLYLLGGAPTQDMYDLKPGAPEKIRGEHVTDLAENITSCLMFLASVAHDTKNIVLAAARSTCRTRTRPRSRRRWRCSTTC